MPLAFDLANSSLAGNPKRKSADATRDDDKPVVAFKDGNYLSVADAWKRGLNEEKYRHGLTVSLGNGSSVSEQHVKRRLKYIALRLKRRIWGNNHKDQRKIEFLVFHHSGANNKHKNKEEKEKGSLDWSWDLIGRQCQGVGERYQALQSMKRSSHEHYHALMHLRGHYGWSDQEIADAITEMERMRHKKHDEKEVHVNFDWWNGNGFHGYVAREVDQEERTIRKKRNGKWADFVEQQDKWFELVI